MLNELETARQPWRDVQNHVALCRKVVDRRERPQPVATGAIGALIVRCWAASPTDRPAMEAVASELP